MKAIVRVLILAALPVVVGCGSMPSPSPLGRTPQGDRSGDPPAAAAARTALSLEDARTAYFDGVRAYVQEDLGAAREHFERCRQAVIAAGSGAADRREAEVLSAKADYFLHKLDEMDHALAVPEPVVRGDIPETDGWPLRYPVPEPVMNEDVERWLNYFTGDGRHVYQRWLDRQHLFQPVIDEVLAEHGLPHELTYHAMIESGYSTSAYSWAHAVGLWQFIRTTGVKFGLRSDWWVDERRDPHRASHAAAKYLMELYDEFQDWELALAAYNVGEARIRSQIRKQQAESFWDLKLPRETRNHIPKFYAAMILGTDAEAYGFTRITSEPRATETIHVDVSVDFEVLGECCGTSAATLAELNPALIRRATPPDDEGYPIVVPAGSGQRALAALADLPPEKRVRWANHRVRRGDTLSEIAEQYRTSVYAVAEANGLRSVNRLRVGQELLIPQGSPKGGTPPKVLASASGPTTSRKVTYAVRSGDTLSEIAEKHGTTTSRLRSWNRIDRYIHPGQKLTIWQGAKASAPAEEIVSVRRGDTLWEIARRHGVSLTTLLRANGLNSKSLIKPGDRIRVPRS